MPAAIRARSEQSVLSISINLFLNELHLGKLSETVIVRGNAPHNRPCFLVSHVIGNRASFLCTKAPMLRGSFWMASDQRVFMRHLRGLRVARRPLGRDVSEGASSAGLAWLDRPAVILSVNACDPPPLKWSDLRYVSDIQEDYNGKEALQA